MDKGKSEGYIFRGSTKAVIRKMGFLANNMEHPGNWVYYYIGVMFHDLITCFLSFFALTTSETDTEPHYV